jgi:Tol biopolymer transport system component
VTQATADIIFFAPSPIDQLAYTVQMNETDTAVWLADSDGRSPQQLLTCEQAICDQLVWHPDGRRLVYERRDLAAMGSPHLWWLDTKTGESITVLADETGVSSGAQFSADGQWISYVAHETEGIEVYNFADGRRLNFSSGTGRPAIWSPITHSLLVSDYDLVVFHGSEDNDHESHSHSDVQAIHLFLTELETPGQTEIGDNLPSDDASPAWSADGAWLVMGRKVPRTPMGRQLWLMHPDGSEARELTDEPEIHHGLPSWSADGRYILFQRFPVFESEAAAGIWLLDIESGEQVEIAAIGRLPVWGSD